MRVAVTGATGNVGTSVVEPLVDDEAVTGIRGLARRLPDWRPPKVQWHSRDIATDDLPGVVAGADAVVHLAWIFQPTHDPIATWENNVIGSRRLLEAVAEAGVPTLVHASSVGTYSPGPEDEGRVDESWANDAARDLVDAEVLADLLDARVVALPRPLARRGLAVRWRLHVVPASPHLLDLALRLPLMDTGRAERELCWTARWSARDALAGNLEGMRGGTGAGTPPLERHAGGRGRIGEFSSGVGQRGGAAPPGRTGPSAPPRSTSMTTASSTRSSPSSRALPPDHD